MTRARCERGFTLLEMLLATALFGLMVGVLFTVVEPARDLFVVQPEVQDVQQRLRFGVATVQSVLTGAGASMTTGPLSGAALQSFAAVRPYRIGDRNPDPAIGITFRPDAVSVISVPPDAAPARIRSVSLALPVAIIEAEPNCRGTEVCGFTVGSRVAAVDLTGRAWFGTVRQIAGTLIDVESPSPEATMSAATGAMLTPVEQTTFSLAVDRATGISRLMAYDGHLSDAPVLDHVIKLAFEYFGDSAPPALVEDDAGATPWLSTTYGPFPPGAHIDNDADNWLPGENCTFAVVDDHHVSRLAMFAAGGSLTAMPASILSDGPWCPDEASVNRFDADLLRIRRVDVVLRVQVSFGWMRGAASLRFVNGGSGRRESSLVPDQEIRFVAATRNLAAVGR
jgi:prepilin-type N-terminal cleavage/methylation domain-containing protein